MPPIPSSFKGIALFTPAGDCVYCVDPLKQGRWHLQLCAALQAALHLPEMPHFLVPCYIATVDRWWDTTARSWQLAAELSPNVYRYRTLLNHIFGLENCSWQLSKISPGVCDPILLYRYQEQFPTLWESHNLAIEVDSTQPVAPDQQIPAKPQGYILRLFVAGYNHQTEKALENLHHLLEQSLDQPYILTVIDIIKHPDEAEANQITATPTLLRVNPLPERRLVGNFNTVSHLLRLLG